LEISSKGVEMVISEKVFAVTTASPPFGEFNPELNFSIQVESQIVLTLLASNQTEN
jgi:hypothetical protein